MTQDETVGRESVLMYMQNAVPFQDQQAKLSVIPEKTVDLKGRSTSPNDETPTLETDATHRAKDYHSTQDKQPEGDPHDATRGNEAKGEKEGNDVTKALHRSEGEGPQDSNAAPDF